MENRDPAKTRCVLPMTSGRDLSPGEVATVTMRSHFSEFPDKVYFSNPSFEVIEVSLRPWKKTPLVIRTGYGGGRNDLASIGDLLCRVILPANVDLAITVRNVGDSPRPFLCGIGSNASVVDRRNDLLRYRSHTRRPLDFASWWSEDHQRIVDLSHEEATEIDAALMKCRDGSPRIDLRLSLNTAPLLPAS